MLILGGRSVEAHSWTSSNARLPYRALRHWW